MHHPVASAIATKALEKIKDYEYTVDAGVSEKVMVTEVTHELGRGVRGRATVAISECESHSWALAIGSPAYIRSLGIEVSLAQLPTEQRFAMITPVIVAVDRTQVGIFVLQDAIRPDAVSVIRDLKNMGLKVGMVTGDDYSCAITTSRQVGIDADMVFAGCSPKRKAGIVKDFRRHGSTIFVGDNLNDIPSFKSASFSICAPNSDTWSSENLHLADATLAHTLLDQESDRILTRIPFLIHLSRQTVRITTQNLWWAAIYNTVSLLWASGTFNQIHPSSL